MSDMNNTKLIMCNIIIYIKEDKELTYKNLLNIYQEFGSKLTTKQLTSILKHEGEGVSIKVLDELIYRLGYTTEVIMKPYY